MSSIIKRLVHMRWLRVVFGIFISLLSLYLSLREFSVEGVMQVVSNANWFYILLAFMCLVLHHWSKAVRWQLLLEQAQTEQIVKVDFRDILLSMLAGQMINLIYPARMGDLSRVMVIGDRGFGRMAVVGTIIFEKALDSILYAGLIMALVWFVAIPEWLTGSLVSLVGVLLVLWGIFYLTARRPAWWNEIEIRLLQWQARWLDQNQAEKWMQSFRSSFSSSNQRSSWQVNLKMLAWSALAWSMAFLINLLALLALDLHLESWTDMLAATLLILVGLQAGISIPSAPGRVGIFEYICVLALGVFGVSETAAFVYGVLLHLLVMLPLLIAGLCALTILGLKRRGAEI